MAIADPYGSSDTIVITDSAQVERTARDVSLLPDNVALGAELTRVRAYLATGDWLPSDACLVGVSETASGQFMDCADLRRALRRMALWWSMPVEAPTKHEPLLSPLGERLAAIRARIVASGTPLLSWDELDAEMAGMRNREPHES